MDCDIFISVHNLTKYAIKVGYHANNCDWCDYVLSWRDWYNRISTHGVTSLIWCVTCKFATFQGFVIKWIHNPACNPVSGYKIKWESTKYRSKMAVGTYELSIENWTYGSDETYPKQVLQDFKKVGLGLPFFLKIAYFAPLNALRAHTAWSKKTTLLQRFLGHACLQHYTWVAPRDFAHHFVIYWLFQNAANENQHQDSNQRETVSDKFVFFSKLARQKKSIGWAKYVYVCEWDMCWRNFCNFSLMTKKMWKVGQK